MSNAIDQAKSGFAALETYFNNLASYVSTGSSLPELNLLPAALVFDEILTFTVDRSQQGADFSVGAGVESVNHFVAVSREISIIQLGKTALYLSSVSEHEEEGDFYGQNAAFMSSVIRGAVTTGSQC